MCECDVVWCGVCRERKRGRRRTKGEKGRGKDEEIKKKEKKRRRNLLCIKPTGLDDVDTNQVCLLLRRHCDFLSIPNRERERERERERKRDQLVTQDNQQLNFPKMATKQININYSNPPTLLLAALFPYVNLEQ